MKFINHTIVIATMAMTSFYVNATGSQWILWTESNGTAMSSRGWITNGNTLFNIELLTRANPVDWYAAKVVTTGVPANLEGTERTLGWILLEREFKFYVNNDPRHWIKLSLDYGASRCQDRGQSPGYCAIPDLNGYHESISNQTNFDTAQGSTIHAQLINSSSVNKIVYNISMSPSTPAGTYSIPVRAVLAAEEQKWYGSPNKNELTSIGRIMENRWGSDAKTYYSTVSVVNRCSLSTNEVSIDHGVIGPVKNSASSDMFSVNCDSSASFKLQLKGDQSKNVSNCGAGTCALTFENEQGLDSITGIGSKSTKIVSTYTPPLSSIPVTGQFRGSAILTLTIN